MRKKSIASLHQAHSMKNENAGKYDSGLEPDQPSELQKNIEQKIAEDEQVLKGDDLSGELSRDRTHMSEHRTRMSEHRTGLSRQRTDLSEHRTELSERRTGLSDQRTILSFQRTALSYERTLMSWIRTATSLISFGFTIYKFFEEFQNANPGRKLITPRMVGMLMIGFGLMCLLFAQVQHQRALKKLKEDYPGIERSLSSVLGILVLLFGFLLFITALLKQ